ncbi:S41 family peptidase [Magnetospira sp. QH-2]|uniref:S41 family peptidase n=1 Tax=Magnetospira sp. (strain QH-2) TaxID=1288970 RepID=UPI0003E817DC|nr:S41 family peptidase [Magnetospira sp. QH-2]CCQ74141.1 Carboxy-terminal-processing protease (modular protein) [Magnetospira sp. QH-2]
MAQRFSLRSGRAGNLAYRSGLLVVGFLIGGLLTHVLAGCVGANSAQAVFGLGRLFDDLGSEAEKELSRFQDVYLEVSTTDNPQQLEHFRNAFSKVRTQYVQPVVDADLIDAAIEGLRLYKPEEGKEQTDRHLVEAALDAMMEKLDPHSSYLNPQEFKEMQVTTQGQFGGLGILVTLDKESGAVKVISPIDDTPAFRAGLKANDLITHLDGKAVKGKKLTDAVRVMRGKPGTSIRLTVLRGENDVFDVTLRRDIVHVKAVKWRAEGDIGYIRVSRFSQTTDEGTVEAIEALRAEIGPKLKGYVLDLRNNPGGLLSESVTLADSFLDEGQVVSVRGRDGRNGRDHNAKWGDLARGLPIVVLINEGSASASEIVAAALQDHRRATVMGARSFGKGSVQVVSRLDLEGALKLTTDLYYVPSGRAIQGVGVLPDIVLQASAKKEDKSSAKAASEDETSEAEVDAKTEAEAEEHRARREADLPNALKVDHGQERQAKVTLSEDRCPPAGEEGKDKALGCALAYLHSGSTPGFLTAVKATDEAGIH